MTGFIVSVVSVIEPALKEYDKLKNKYEIEKGCRSKAQSYAADVSTKNGCCCFLICQIAALNLELMQQFLRQSPAKCLLL